MDVTDWSREDIGELYRRTKDLRSSMSAVSRNRASFTGPSGQPCETRCPKPATDEARPGAA